MESPPRVDLRSLMARAEAAAPVGTVDAVAAGLLEMLGADEVSFLIADFSGRTLSRLGHTAAGDGHDRETSERVALEGTPQGDALARQEAVLVQEGARTRVLAPVTSRGEAVGVLELALPFDPLPTTLEDLALAAHQLAYLVIANRRFTDLYEWGQRTVPLSLAAEIQRRLLPADLHLRGRAVPARRLARACRPGRRRHVRLLAGPGHVAPVAHRRDGPLGELRAAGDVPRRKPAVGPPVSRPRLVQP